MSQPFNKYNSGIFSICTAVINLNSDAFNLVLSNAAPAVTQTSYSGGVGEIATGNGYTQGTGIPVVSPSFTLTAAVATLTGTAGLLTATGAIPTFSYVIMYDSTAPSKPLIGWWQTAASVTMANTDTFQVTWGSNQILQFS
jgi:hypothetical protein